MVLSEEDKILMTNWFICKGRPASQLIRATRAGLSKTLSLQYMDELKRHLIDRWSSVQHGHPTGDH